MQKAKFIEKHCRIKLPNHFAEQNVVIEESDVAYIIRKVEVKPILSTELKAGIENSLKQAADGQLEEFDAEKELEEFESIQG